MTISTKGIMLKNKYLNMLKFDEWSIYMSGEQKNANHPATCNIMYDFLFIFYSYLNASIGSSWAAFLAGYQPKNTPVNVHTAKLITIVHGSMDIGQWAKLLMA